MTELIIIGVVLIIVGVLGRIYLEKKLNIIKRTNTMTHCAKSVQFFTLFILVIIYLIAVIVLSLKYETSNLVYILLPYLLLLSSVKGFMDWKFNKPSKQWVLHIYELILYCVLLIAILCISPIN